jgi:predicted ABC-type ATPase
VSPAPEAGRIVVLAGTNGAGKSSVAGEALRRAGGAYYNPDEVTRRFLERDPALSLDEANARAWRLGRLLLHRAIEQRLEFVFETTLGGRTITGLLQKAANLGIPVHVFYVGLESADRHVARVRARVERGGHDIPEPTIRRRYDTSRANLVALVPHLTELKVADNSAEGDPAGGRRPEPKLIVHLRAGTIVQCCALAEVPGWAKAIVLAALRVGG